MRKLVLFLCVCSSFGLLSGQVYLFEDFNNGIDTTAGGWTILNGGNTNDNWYGTSGGFMGQYLDGTEFAFVNSDAAGSGPIYLHEELISPVLNTAGAPLLLLEFDQYFRHVASTDTGFVDVFDGTQWVGIDTFTLSEGTFGAPAQKSYDITSLANANLQLRYVYDDDTSWAWYWGVDNVRLYTPASLDAAVEAIVDPANNGRINTGVALGANQNISIGLANLGLDTLFNIPLAYTVNMGTPVLDTFPGPLDPGMTVTYTFSQTSNLSAVGNYHIEAWCAVAMDLDLTNDTSVVDVIQLSNDPVVIPFCQDFEMALDTTMIGNFIGLAGAREIDLETQDQNSGRLRTNSGYSNSGARAITLDRSPSGATIVNYAIATYNMSNYNAQNEQVIMDLGIMEHGDEPSPNDSVWVRGCDTCNWIGVSGWNSLTGNNNGTYYFISAYDVSNALSSRGQNFSNTFQVRVGQEDNFPATSPSGSDGMSFDDLCFDLILDSNAAATNVISPDVFDCGDSAMVVAIEVTNNGADSLVNVPVEAQLSGLATLTLNGIMAGPLAPGARDTVLLSGTFNSFAGGQLDILAYTQLGSDQLHLDDTIQVSLMITPIPAAPQVGGDTVVCLGNSANLVIANPLQNTSYSWYDSLGGPVIAMGNSVQLGPINTPSTYYVNAAGLVSNTLGPVDNTSGTGAQYNNYVDGLIFDVYRDITIDSVDVYPSDTGDVVVIVFDDIGGFIGSSTATVNPATPGGKVTIPVGIQVPAGTDYTISADGSTVTNLYRNSSGYTYPYTEPGVASITASINGLSTTGYYYFFYNWKISSASCFGDFTTVMVDTTAFSTTIGDFSSTAMGLTATFADSSTNSLSSDWDFGDGNTGTGLNPSHTYSAPGTYLVCMIANGPCESDTFCDSVTVTCQPLVAGFGSTINELTIGFTESNPEASAWSWDFGDSNTDTVQNPTHVYATDGIYPVCLTVSNPCGQSLQTCDTFTVCGPLIAGFNFNQNGSAWLGYDFLDASTGVPVSWHWDFGDGDTSNVQNPSHVYPSFGTYTITFTVINLCGDTSVAFQTQLVTGIEDELGKSLSVYPNPSPGRFHISLGNLPVDKASMQILTLQGKRIWEKKFTGVGSLDEVVEPGLPTGTYFLEVKADGRRSFRKLVIQ